jgi:CheY-like chemotaxis protein
MSPGIRVLLVDDYEDTLEVYGHVLGWRGFDVELASGGEEAVRKAQASPPSVVIMDIFMPVVDGVEATRRLKADERTKNVPVIALTAKPADPSSPFPAGLFLEVLTKPCRPEVLFGAIERALAGC